MTTKRQESLSDQLIRHASEAAETAYEKIVLDGNRKRGSLVRGEVVERIRGAILSSVFETLRLMRPSGIFDIDEARRAIEKMVLGDSK